MKSLTSKNDDSINPIVPRCESTNFSGAQSVPNGGVATTITLPVENYDTHSMHSLTTNTGRITIPDGWPGQYLICGKIIWSVTKANFTTDHSCWIIKNGATTLQTWGKTNIYPYLNYTYYFFETVAFLVPGDYLEIQGKHSSSGGSVNAYASLNIHYVGGIPW
jgi:hypothetical protein